MRYEPSKALAYIEGLLAPSPPLAFDGDAAGRDVQPDVGPLASALLAVLVRALRPSRILEIGTCLGSTACALGRAARDHCGEVVTIEIDEELAAIARANVESAGLDGVVTVIHADARESLASIPGAFGLILQDGAKEDYLRMLPILVERLEPGGILITDDVLFPVMDLPIEVEPWGRAVAAYNEALRACDSLETVWLPVGDGIAISVKRDGTAAAARLP